MATPDVECHDGLGIIESSDGGVSILQPPRTEQLSISHICPGAKPPPGSILRLGLHERFGDETRLIGNSVYLNGYGEAIGRNPIRTAGWVLNSLLAMPEEKYREVFRLIKDGGLETGKRGKPLEDFPLFVNPVYPNEGAPEGALFGLDILNVVEYRTYIVFEPNEGYGDVSAIRGYRAMPPEEIHKSFSGLPENAKDMFLFKVNDYCELHRI